MEGGFGEFGLDFSAFVAAEEQGADQIHDASLEAYQLGVPVTEWGQLTGAGLSASEWGRDPMELGVPQEAAYASADLNSSSKIPSSASTTDDTSPSTDDIPAETSDEGPSSNAAQSSIALNGTISADEWLCDLTNCGKSFTHRHKLKYVQTAPNTLFPTS